jgi:DNA-binding CsgD family transcriptional regulator
MRDALRITENLFDFAVRHGDGTAIGSVGFDLSRLRYQLLDDDGAIQATRDAITALDRKAHPRLAFNLLATLAWYLAQLRRTAEAAAVLAEAEPLREFGDDRGLVRYYEASAARKVHDGEGLAYRNDIEAALATAEPSKDSDPRFYVSRLDTGIALSMASHLDDMEFCRKLREKLWEFGQRVPPYVAGASLAMSGYMAFLSGELERAKQLVAMGASMADDAPLLSFIVARAGIPAALHLDDQLLLRRCARPRLLERAFASNTPNVFGPVAAAVAAQLRSQRRVDEARALVAQAVRRLPDAANNIPLIIEAARCEAADALVRAMPMLERLMQNSRSGAGGWHLVRAYGSNGQERREHAVRAAELFHEIGWRLYEAEALELAGETPQALELYRACGAVSDVKRIEATQSARVNSGLSKREHEVAKLVAEGRSNKRIAEALSLSERTVENHIASIFSKLSLRSRAEVAAFIARAESSAG